MSKRCSTPGCESDTNNKSGKCTVCELELETTGEIDASRLNKDDPENPRKKRKYVKRKSKADMPKKELPVKPAISPAMHQIAIDLANYPKLERICRSLPEIAPEDMLTLLMKPRLQYLEKEIRL